MVGKYTWIPLFVYIGRIGLFGLDSCTALHWMCFINRFFLESDVATDLLVDLIWAFL